MFLPKPKQFKAIIPKNSRDKNLNNSDFVYREYQRDLDDCSNIKVRIEDQTFLHKDYAKNINDAFPKIDNKEKDEIIQKTILNGEGIHWTNKALSYMRKDILGKRLMNAIYFPEIAKEFKIEDCQVDFVDATSNIGGTTLLFAMQDWVRSVNSYELDNKTADILENNIKLYEFENKTTIHRGRFDYEIPPESVVTVDPPFEMGNNSGHFNLSIESAPIYYVVEDILAAGAKMVFLEMPSEFTYNSKFAEDYKHNVAVFHVDWKKIKIYRIKRGEYTEFERFDIVPQGATKARSVKYIDKSKNINYYNWRN